MSSPRRSTLTKPKPQPALPEVVQAKPERFVLSSGHDAHDLLNAAEAELKECSGTLFDHFEQRHEPTPLDSESAPDILNTESDDDNDCAAEHRDHSYQTNLHVNAVPRQGDRTRRMIMSPPRKKLSKQNAIGPQTYDELEALMKSLDQTLTEKDKILHHQHTIYQVAINHLCEENIVKQQEAIRFTTMQHEVEHIQHHIQKNTIMRVDFDEETMPRSAVYRHAVHMTAVADLGVRIYNVGDHPREATDRIVVARRLSATPSTPHNKAKNNTGRRYVNEAQPRLMKNQKYIERDKEFL
ncbi:hypothetical protein H310_03604 [Aphanomyces invadans]|uniref:Uncharacterized protein n=1 Tax=Aphanomyces invadans TaxID=157072 RepID=A0A024UI82_9STRA|nr:hypothetical protein H310_03604 [Aphanomyces invadans]ETW05984.1 hypothetical protein H310_03604 [Aphanomyces invadans]|eukprot:XP_008865761.1 hypothetical protein H310_03604 [Aphanomyces invadans]